MRDNRLALPLLGFLLGVVGIVIGYLALWQNWDFYGLILLITMLSALAGVILGFLCLRRKDQIGTSGVALSVAAIAIPAITVVFLLVFFIGNITGVISTR
ncbi:MAG: hypothetical protein LBG99_07980 [Propionibacteriaceae bacterium]|jgi:hypothetical protein|nr:hypothetical protein [Propionibacteriaceae bacterium]